MTTPAMPAPCLHTHTTHQHGTHACYVLDRCRCQPCRAAAAEYERKRVRRNAYGRANLIDAGPVRDHVHALQAAGLGRRRIAELAGVSSSVLTNLLYPTADREQSSRVTRATAEKVLAVRAAPAAAAAGARVSSVGTRRRLQALVAVGWSQAKLAERLGVTRSAINHIVAGASGHVTNATAQAVICLYDELWDQAPPQGNHRDRIAASRTRSYAKARGWAPPLAWDDDAIDDPSATADLGDSTPMPGRAGTHIEDVECLASSGAGREETAARLGVEWESVSRACVRAGRSDLIDRIDRNDFVCGRERRSTGKAAA
ncbi:helix-turn-helix domain-containing protein [Arsenicicoccus dermatophilus]|uniref:helix-turn-helix domain-containing protein n=1 Tax=Arsenicicoccus dermatophilus TaxID=1076331 RepID=UPI001F4CAB35|nr:helix-turn-helix transcriptional regulator [Arsenicicoccus dermatophilus]MCH8613436.1 helix-turn-helix domain-containing protein [Arsenicicoccus dermatophilus]